MGDGLMLARTAASFIDTVGANVHMYYTGGVYHPDYERVGRLLERLGVRHVRDGHHANRGDSVQAWNYLYYVHGVKVTLIEDYRSNGTLAQRLDQVASGRIAGVAAIEGPNEINSTAPFAEPGVHPEPSWVQPTVAYMRDLRDGMASRGLAGLPLLDPSLTNWQAWEFYKRAGGGQYADTGNIHPYPNVDAPPSPELHASVTGMVERVHGAGFPFQVTETGYHTAYQHAGGHQGVTDDVQAAYTVPLLLETWLRGCQRTFLYELVDQGGSRSDLQQQFGLAYTASSSAGGDLELKPSGRAVANLMALIDRPGAAPASDHPVTVTGPARSVLLRRGDGSHALVLWQNAGLWDKTARQAVWPVPASVSVAVNWPDVTSWERHAVRFGGCRVRGAGTSLNVTVPTDDIAVVTF